MNQHQRVYLALISQADPLFSKEDSAVYSQKALEQLKPITSEALSELYVESAFLQTFVDFLKEQHWLYQKQNPIEEFLFQSFVTPYLQLELSPRSYLHGLLELASIKNLKSIKYKSYLLELIILKIILERSYDEQKSFSKHVLNSLSKLFDLESMAKNVTSEVMSLTMYRTFDNLDVVFNLNYGADIGMKTDLKIKERLYEGAGVGVQSSYSTVLTALRHLNLSLGSRFIDLGSGYGRLGFVVGLMRPDVDFIGYEFVQHRVDGATAMVKNFSIENHVHFYTQDLSSRDFHIPDAEIYYMYDPFSHETYEYILSQLIKISHRRKIIIATKGNARQPLMEVSARQGWPPHQEFDHGNLCLFSST